MYLALLDELYLYIDVVDGAEPCLLLFQELTVCDLLVLHKVTDAIGEVETEQ